MTATNAMAADVRLRRAYDDPVPAARTTAADRT